MPQFTENKERCDNIQKRENNVTVCGKQRTVSQYTENTENPTMYRKHRIMPNIQKTQNNTTICRKQRTIPRDTEECDSTETILNKKKTEIINRKQIKFTFKAVSRALDQLSFLDCCDGDV